MRSRRSSSEFISRRSWAALLASAVPALAQVVSTPPPQGSPQPAKTLATPEARLQKAQADVRKSSDRLAQIELPMDIEPAFSFKAING